MSSTHNARVSTMAKTYTELTITADDELREQLVGILSQLGFEGFWEEGTSLRCYMNRTRWNDSLLTEVQHVAATLHRSASSPAPTVSLNTLEEKNWNEEWEQTIQPIHVTERIVITPTWHSYEAQPGEIVLTIDPKMSFGTGYHETTRLVLKLLERFVKRGSTLLDVGTGTGVLAIAGIKLGAASALGVDNDDWSYTNALENVELNTVGNQVRIIPGDLSSVPDGTYDVIAANIQRNVLEPILPALNGKLNPGGSLLLSGLLNVDEQPMLKAAEASGLEIVEVLRENEWIAIAATRH